MSARTNPFDQLEQLFRRLSDQYDETADAWEFERPFGDLARGAEMAADVIERDESFVVTVDLPGFERENVDIQATDRTLRIDAERETSLENEDDRFVRRERHQESAYRAIRLPDDVRKDEVTATMEMGVLTITLPRREIEEGQRIEIE